MRSYTEHRCRIGIVVIGILTLALIACSSSIQVDEYDISTRVIDQNAGTFYVQLDTDISSEHDGSLKFGITAKRMYRTKEATLDSLDQLHTVYSDNTIALGDLREGVVLTAWVDKDFDTGHRPSKMSDTSLNREITRRAQRRIELGKPWTSIEILPEFCVSLWPTFDGKAESERLEGKAVYLYQRDGKEIGRISQDHVRECVRFGEYRRLR